MFSFQGGHSEKQVCMVLVRPKLRRIKNVVLFQFILSQDGADVSLLTAAERERRRRMREDFDPVASHLIKAFYLLATSLSAGNNNRRAAEKLVVKSFAMPPRSSGRYFRKPRLQPVLQVPNDGHVR